MRRMRDLLFSVLVVAVVASSNAGCSSSSDSPSTTSDTGTDAGGLSPLDPANCVAPGTKPNEKGMGGYCEPSNASKTRGGQCDKAGPDGAARICTADVPDTPAHGWFCTYPCSKDEECGTGAYCAHDVKGSGCVPTICKGLGGDAGPGDGGSDAATTETASDAASD
jgi:hypothetical protein